MRYLLLLWLVLPPFCYAQTLWEQAGLRPLCAEVKPLLAHGLAEPQALVEQFPDDLCKAFSVRLAHKLPATVLNEAFRLLQRPELTRLGQAELQASLASENLAHYRKMLQQKPVKAERLALIRRLNQASYSAQLAYQLRYEVGQTQVFWLLLNQHQAPTDKALEAMTHAPSIALKKVSDEGVESFMLYAYRMIESEQLTQAIAVYQSDEVAALLAAANDVISEYFSERRVALNAAAPQSHVAQPLLE